ncbi:hypothetical protein J2790_001172 [Paenarthrobacter nicotinovorans]|uniref:hypothetical protein n=1 Tax=Micrococcaceae TaxID=1268 RepID=UPI0008763BAB|nr:MULTISPECIES: hypothetical protein [Micrococcaceae]MDR6436051.1 hypothetical protein [Paenarthrobacter nicotinovorans]SCZ51473.1 hypothetical protein SAMN02799638_00918 [Arthrobacter sp. UNCCL28]
MFSTDIGALFTSPDWGSVPDWLAGVGTISAVLVALHLGRRDGKRLREEREEAKADREAAARERAEFRQQREAELTAAKRKLAAQVTVVNEIHRAGKIRYDTKLLWKVHNGGEEPISKIVIARREMHPDADPLTTLHAQWQSIEAGGIREILTPFTGDMALPESEVQFTDGTGVRWQRKDSGELRQLAEDDPENIRVRSFPIPYYVVPAEDAPLNDK